MTHTILPVYHDLSNAIKKKPSSFVDNYIPGGGVGVGVFGASTISSGCDFLKPLKGPSSKHSFRRFKLTSVQILINPTAVPST
jgi:hypothetical protein